MPLRNHRFGALDETADTVPPLMVRCGVNELQLGLAQIDSTAEPANDIIPPADVSGAANESDSPKVDPLTTGTAETP